MYNKYNARKVDLDGMTFDSKREAERYCELRLLERSGEIGDLQRQIRIELIPKIGKNRASYYVADFAYYDKRSGERVYEDVKGYKNGQAYQLFVLKKKLMFWRYGIDIKET